MAYVDVVKKEIQLKIVYYGPGQSGKTTSLEYLFGRFKKDIDSEMIVINTRGDRTIFFDYVPLSLGTIKGLKVKMQLYTVPGQVKYNAIRKVVLKGVDGVVFVADSMKENRLRNKASLKNLQENLKAHNKSIFNIPLVFQYNKRDKTNEPNLLSIASLQKDLNTHLKVPHFSTSAKEGKNIVPALNAILKRAIISARDLIC